MPKCAHCGAGSDFLQAGFDTYHCLNCNGQTTMDANPVPRDAQFEGGHIPSELRPT